MARRYKKNNAGLRILCVVLALILAAGLTLGGLELWGTGKMKPSKWFKKDELAPVTISLADDAAPIGAAQTFENGARAYALAASSTGYPSTKRATATCTLPEGGSPDRYEWKITGGIGLTIEKKNSDGSAADITAQTFFPGTATLTARAYLGDELRGIGSVRISAKNLDASLPETIDFVYFYSDSNADPVYYDNVDALITRLDQLGVQCIPHEFSNPLWENSEDYDDSDFNIEIADLNSRDKYLEEPESFDWSGKIEMEEFVRDYESLYLDESEFTIVYDDRAFFMRYDMTHDRLIERGPDERERTYNFLIIDEYPYFHDPLSGHYLSSTFISDTPSGYGPCQDLCDEINELGGFGTYIANAYYLRYAGLLNIYWFGSNTDDFIYSGTDIYEEYGSAIIHENDIERYVERHSPYAAQWFVVVEGNYYDQSIENLLGSDNIHHLYHIFKPDIVCDAIREVYSGKGEISEDDTGDDGIPLYYAFAYYLD